MYINSVCRYMYKQLQIYTHYIHILYSVFEKKILTAKKSLP